MGSVHRLHLTSSLTSANVRTYAGFFLSGLYAPFSFVPPWFPTIPPAPWTNYKLSVPIFFIFIPSPVLPLPRHCNNPPKQFSSVQFTAVRTRSNTLGSIANDRRRQTRGRQTNARLDLLLELSPTTSQTCRHYSAAKCHQSGP